MRYYPHPLSITPKCLDIQFFSRRACQMQPHNFLSSLEFITYILIRKFYFYGLNMSLALFSKTKHKTKKGTFASFVSETAIIHWAKQFHRHGALRFIGSTLPIYLEGWIVKHKITSDEWPIYMIYPRHNKSRLWIELGWVLIHGAVSVQDLD